MTRMHKNVLLRFGLAVAACFLAMGFLAPALARAADETNIRVVVKEATDDEPIYQAHLTLQFQQVKKLKRDKWIAFSAKTDKQGQCTFRHIPKGPIRLLITAEHHQSFGKEFEIDKEDQVIEVKLRKPQPQI